MKRVIFLLALLLAWPLASQTFTGNNLGTVSVDNRIFPGTVQIGGTATAGNNVTLTVNVGTSHYPFTVSAISGDTPQTIVDRFIAALNASPAMQGYGITGLQGNPTVTAFSVTPQRGRSAVPTIAVSVSSGATLTAAVTRQPSDSLDAAPLLYLDRDVGAVHAGDTIGPIIFGMGDSVTPNCCTTAYTMLQSIVVNPNPSAIEGAFAIDNACYLPSYGNVCNRILIGRGVQVFDAGSLPPAGGDMGAGTINLPASGGIYKAGAPISGRSTLGGNSTVQLTQNAVNWVGLAGASSTDVFSVLIPAAVSGSLKSLSVSLNSAPGAGQTYTATVLVNGAPSGLSCSISGAATYCADSTHTVAVPAPASVVLQVTVSSGAAAAKLLWSTELAQSL